MRVTNTSQHTRASIATYTGVEFFPLAPRFEDIYAGDVAHALSNLCRYNGHTVEHYSVAQHSVLVSEFAYGLLAPPLDEDEVDDFDLAAKWGLLHDASEAYVADICSPIKPFIHGYREIEEQLMVAVAQRFGLPWPMPDVVKYADKAVFRAEVESGVMRPVDWWHIHPEHPHANLKVQPWPAKEAEERWLERFRKLFGEEVFSATYWPPRGD